MSSSHAHSLGYEFGKSSRQNAVWFVAMWLLLGVMLFWRGVAGHFSGAPGNAVLIFLAILLPTLSFAIRWSREPEGIQQRPTNLHERLLHYLPSVSLVLMGVAMTLSDFSVAGLVLLWVGIGAEIFFGAAAPWTWRLLPLSTKSDEIKTELQSTSVATTEVADIEYETDELPWLWSDPTARQDQRRVAIEGGEAISGAVRVSLAAGQEQIFEHVAFCPPLAGALQVDVELIEPERAKITAVQVLPNGIRWEVKLIPAEKVPVEVCWSYVVVNNESNAE